MTAKKPQQSWEASPANQFRQRVSGKLKPIRDGSGPSSYASSLEYNPDTLSWRTSQGFFPQEWEAYSVTFPPSGTMRNGIVSPQRPLVRPISDGAYSSWPTPTTAPGAPNKGSNKKSGPTSLEEAARVGSPTWPTPQASDHRDRGNLSTPAIQRRRAVGKQLSLSMVVSEVSGRLNPTWVEWLMGFPLGWTDLEHLETP